MKFEQKLDDLTHEELCFYRRAMNATPYTQALLMTTTNINVLEYVDILKEYDYLEACIADKKNQDIIDNDEEMPDDED